VSEAYVHGVSEQERARLAAGRCINGCDAPVSPPSKVVCRACLDRMGEALLKAAQALGSQEEP
jgi:hypothetical protein